MCVPSKFKPLALSLAMGGETTPVTAVNKKAESVPGKVRLWDLNEKYHCPVIGTCIPMADLIRLALRHGVSMDMHDEFTLHVDIVGRARSRNSVSEAVQRYLDKKYSLQLGQFSRLKTDAEVRQLWKQCLESGDVAGALWATLSHKAASAETRHGVYAEIHMLSHQVGARQVADARYLLKLETENAELKKILHGEREVVRQMGIQLQQLRAELLVQQERSCTAEAALEACQQRLLGHESGQAVVELRQEISALKKAHHQLQAIEQHAWMLEKRLLTSQAEVLAFSQERDREKSERERLEQLLSVLLDERRPSECLQAGREQCGACEHALTSRCILYVGGRLSMLAQHRELAERLGIRLLHHDGGLEESLARLPEMLRGADVVLCPTDHISHAAYHQIKSHCKRVGKPCLFYRGAGVSSFTAAINRVACGEFSVSVE